MLLLLLLLLLLALLLGWADTEEVDDAAAVVAELVVGPDSDKFCGSTISILVASGVPWLALLLVTLLAAVAAVVPVALLPSEESTETPLSWPDSSPSALGDSPASSFLSWAELPPLPLPVSDILSGGTLGASLFCSAAPSAIEASSAALLGLLAAEFDLELGSEPLTAPFLAADDDLAELDLSIELPLVPRIPLAPAAIVVATEVAGEALSFFLFPSASSSGVCGLFSPLSDEDAASAAAAAAAVATAPVVSLPSLATFVASAGERARAGAESFDLNS